MGLVYYCQYFTEFTHTSARSCLLHPDVRPAECSGQEELWAAGAGDGAGHQLELHPAGGGHEPEQRGRHHARRLLRGLRGAGPRQGAALLLLHEPVQGECQVRDGEECRHGDAHPR